MVSGIIHIVTYVASLTGLIRKIPTLKPLYLEFEILHIW